MRKTILTLAVVLAMASTAFATGSYVGGGGAVPDDGYNGTLASMFASSVVVPAGEPGGDTVAGVEVDLDMSHTWVGDVVVKLDGPGGLITLLSRPVFAEVGDDGTGCCGDSSNLVIGSLQTFVDGGSISAENLGLAQPSSADPIPAQTLDPHGGTVAGDTSLLATYAGDSAVGTWTLYVGDSAGADLGNVSSWTLRLTTVPEPTSLSLLALGGLALLRRKR